MLENNIKYAGEQYQKGTEGVEELAVWLKGLNLSQGSALHFF